MAFKIVFSYHDGGKIAVSNSSKVKLDKNLAEHYQKLYAKPSNDGGMVYTPPYKNCVPIPLNEFISKLQEGEE